MDTTRATVERGLDRCSQLAISASWGAGLLGAAGLVEASGMVMDKIVSGWLAVAHSNCELLARS